MSSYESDLRSRRQALNVTEEVDHLVVSLAGRAAVRVRPALESYFAVWQRLPGFDAIVRNQGAQLLEAEASYFTALFEGEMDRAYLERLRNIHQVERATGFGVRVHLGAAGRVGSVMFEEIGRRHRWSGQTAATHCAALLRYLVVDCLNAFHFEQLSLKESVTARERAIGGALHSFGGAVTHLRAAMNDASGALAETSLRTATAVEAALEASQQTSEAAERGSSNLVSTAAASAELVNSIGEVDRLANQSLDAVRETTATVGSLRDEIEELERAAREIGSVVTMIAGIASQTNLLALNATIEAARAGEAGRGFSVVASEVKSLANQTADATRDITAQVAAIQAASARSAEQLGRIVGIISRVEEISAAAAAATSEQASATAAIADQARFASEAVSTIQTAADGVRGMMQDLKASSRQWTMPRAGSRPTASISTTNSGASPPSSRRPRGRLAHIPSISATWGTSLSPRPDRFTTIRWSRCMLGASSSTFAMACAGSRAGMIPSRPDRSWKAESASSSVADR